MKPTPIRPPSKLERFTLRLMISTGCIAIVFFLYSVLDSSVRGYAPLYWILMVTFLFTCLKLLYEWYHYLFITVPETPPQTRNFTVDVFTTFCAGEPYEMIVETLRAVKAITYPHETYLCDEANDPYLKEFCNQLGVHHVTRTNKKNAKAGNINNALQRSTGEICVVLDPDHVPMPGFLDPIIPHFAHPEIGYVQVVQAYKNADESLIAKGAAQQTYQFYGPIMMTMNRYGTVPVIGANCTFRRTALESIGGHAAGLAEDLHTAMQLHARGWKSVYVPEVLARGLVPSTLSAYYKQQLKWSKGVFDLLFTAYPKLFGKFTWRQRLHYGLLPMHYLSGIIFLINFLVPIIALCFGISPMHMDLSEFGLVVLPLIALIVLIRHFVQRWVMEEEERGFHVIGGLLLIGSWWVFILGLAYAIAGKKVPYVPTPKDGNEANNWPLNVPNLVVLALSAVAIGYGLLTDWNPYNLIMAGFATLNCFFICVTIAASRQQQFRRLRAGHTRVDAIMDLVKSAKGLLWVFRRQLYPGLRGKVILLTLLLLGGWAYIATSKLLGNEPVFGESAGLSGYGQIASGKKAQAAPAPDLGPVPEEVSSSFSRCDECSFKGNRGMNYLKGSDWHNDYYTFTKKELVADFQEMKKIGINTVKFYGPSFYDHNILRVAEQQQMDLHYGFWVPDGLNFREDKKRLKTLSEAVLSAVGKHKANPRILSWNIGNAVFQNLSLHYSQSELVRQQEAYLGWLRKLVVQMKRADPGRPITLDVEVLEGMHTVVARLGSVIPEIASFGLVYKDHSPRYAIAKNFPHFISYSTYEAYSETPGDSAGVFISHWQDVHTSRRVSFDAVKDLEGRRKNSYLQLAAQWKGGAKPPASPKIKILKSAIATYTDTLLDYHAILKKEGSWLLAKNIQTNLMFEWKLVQIDRLYNPVSTRNVGTGPSLSLRIPQHPQRYRLYLFVLDGDAVINIIPSELNTPL